MQVRNIGIMGDASIGKQYILQAIGRINTPNSQAMDYCLYCIEDKRKTELIRSLKVSNNKYNIQLFTTNGPIFYKHEALSHILLNSDTIVYVFSVDKPLDYQKEHFTMCSTMAKNVGKYIRDIPWLFILISSTKIVNDLELHEFLLANNIDVTLSRITFRPNYLFDAYPNLDSRVKVLTEEYKEIKKIWDLLLTLK